MVKEYGGLIINPYCSNYCVFCRKIPKASLSELKKQEVSIAKNLVEFKKKGIKKIEISGADPIEYSKIVLLINYIKEAGFDFVQLSSHSKRLADKLFLDELMNSGIDKLRIPIYGPEARIHDSVTRTKGSFNATIRGIKKLSEKSSNIQIQITCLITQQNKNYLKEIISLVKELGIIDFYFSIPCVKNNNYSYYLPFKDLCPYVRNAYNYAAEIDYQVSFMEIPSCVFNIISDSINNMPLPPDHGNHCQTLKALRTSVKDLPSYRVKKKIKMCNICKVKDTCDGFFLNDIKKYGAGNLKPII